MNWQILNATIAQVRQRVSEGDCPSTPAQTVETLENALIAVVDYRTMVLRLESALEDVNNFAMERGRLIDALREIVNHPCAALANNGYRSCRKIALEAIAGSEVTA